LRATGPLIQYFKRKAGFNARESSKKALLLLAGAEGGSAVVEALARISNDEGVRLREDLGPQQA